MKRWNLSAKVGVYFLKQQLLLEGVVDRILDAWYAYSRGSVLQRFLFARDRLDFTGLVRGGDHHGLHGGYF